MPKLQALRHNQL